MYATIIVKEKENVNFRVQALGEVGGTWEGLGGRKRGGDVILLQLNIFKNKNSFIDSQCN